MCECEQPKGSLTPGIGIDMNFRRAHSSALPLGSETYASDGLGPGLMKSLVAGLRHSRCDDSGDDGTSEGSNAWSVHDGAAAVGAAAGSADGDEDDAQAVLSRCGF